MREGLHPNSGAIRGDPIAPQAKKRQGKRLPSSRYRDQAKQPSSWLSGATLIAARQSNPLMARLSNPRRGKAERPSSWPDRATLVAAGAEQPSSRPDRATHIAAGQSHPRRGLTEQLSSWPGRATLVVAGQSNPRCGRAELPSSRPD
jgi:hypothetical protein